MIENGVRCLEIFVVRKIEFRLTIICYIIFFAYIVDLHYFHFHLTAKTELEEKKHNSR